MLHVFCEWACGLTNTLKRVDGGNEDVKECWVEEVEYISKYRGRREFVCWHK
jgi:hypothetical protein